MSSSTWGLSSLTAVAVFSVTLGVLGCDRAASPQVEEQPDTIVVKGNADAAALEAERELPMDLSRATPPTSQELLSCTANSDCTTTLTSLKDDKFCCDRCATPISKDGTLALANYCEATHQTIPGRNPDCGGAPRCAAPSWHAVCVDNRCVPSE